MSKTTTNFGLLEKDPTLDATDFFNIQTMLNDNWDRLDAAAALRKVPKTALNIALLDAAGGLADGGYTIETYKTYIKLLTDAVKTALGMSGATLSVDDALIKLNTAVKNLDTLKAMDKLIDTTTTADAVQVDVDLSSIDMSKYSELHVTMRCNADALSTTTMKLQINGLTGTMYKCGSSGSTDYLANPYMGSGGYLSYITLAPIPNGKISAICHGITFDTGVVASASRGGVTLAAQTWLTKLSFVATSADSSGNIYKIMAGTRVTCYGVK